MVERVADTMSAKFGRKIKKAGSENHYRLVYFGRGEKIRTSDPLHPMQVRYQAALRPDMLRIIAEASVFSSSKTAAARADNVMFQ